MTTASVVEFRTKVFRSALTRPSNTTQYTSGDVISAVTTNDHFTFGSSTAEGSRRVGRPGNNTVTLNAVALWSSANQATKLISELWLFKVDIAEVADNSAFAPTDAEMLTLVAIVPLPSANWYVGTSTSGADGNAVCVVRNIDLPIQCSGGGILFGQLVARNAYDPVSAEVFTCDITVTQD